MPTSAACPSDMTRQMRTHPHEASGQHRDRLYSCHNRQVAPVVLLLLPFTFSYVCSPCWGYVQPASDTLRERGMALVAHGDQWTSGPVHSGPMDQCTSRPPADLFTISHYIHVDSDSRDTYIVYVVRPSGENSSSGVATEYLWFGLHQLTVRSERNSVPNVSKPPCALDQSGRDRSDGAERPRSAYLFPALRPVGPVGASGGALQPMGCVCGRPRLRPIGHGAGGGGAGARGGRPALA
eukprot:723363-Prorocentrum_minimum.AAC.3